MNLPRAASLLREKNICVLATVGGTRPHCSLMAYITDDVGREVYMYTRRDTQKYTNLTANPAVSILVDSRGDADRGQIQALTVSGTFEPITDPQKKSAVKLAFLSAHPHLTDLVEHPDAQLLRFRVESFLLLDGPDNAHFTPAGS